ncbi:MAG: calcium-binding protein [Nitrospiraceae bacterium]
MMSNNMTTWLNFALQQMAAESYLPDGAWQDTTQLRRRLLLGNNNVDIDPLEGNLYGKTRFTEVVVSRFLERYQIVDHHANDATGFSATLMFDRVTNSYTLSFRSSEYATEVNGGDRARDILGADAEIATKGFALAQLVSMERYWRELTQPGGKLAANSQINVTGYSLGGHLATVFTELHDQNVLNTYVFNSAGRGLVANARNPEQSETENIRQLIQTLEGRILSYDPQGTLFQAGATGSIYTTSGYYPAVADTEQTFGSVGTVLIGTGSIGNITRNDGPFQKIVQLYGVAAAGFDMEGVSNSGIHASPHPILIENQPFFEGLDQNGEIQYGNTHSITLLVDSMALQELFLDVDPTLTQLQIESIFKASSAQGAVSASPFGSALSEGNTLESALDVIRKVFHSTSTPFQPTPYSRDAGAYGNLALRNQFYAGIQEVRGSLAGGSFQIKSLVDMPVETLKGFAVLPGDAGTAYRYALKELNPFAVVGVDYGARYNPGELDLYDPETGNGAMTLEYIRDRVSFLGRKIEQNLHNGQAGLDQFKRAHWIDLTTHDEIVPRILPGLATNEYIFGGESNDTLEGGFLSDHLYGGDGEDAISGNGGDDYIEGNDGNDTLLSGGEGNDTILGGQGDDLLEGGIGADVLDGGRDTNTLRGGEGIDRYLHSFGVDTIIDSDGKGTIEFGGTLLHGGIRQQNDPENTYRSLDGKFTYVQSGSDLLITGPLSDGSVTIQNFDFEKGMLGIQLTDAGNLGSGALPTITYGTPSHTETYTGTEGNDILETAGGGVAYATVMRGLGGNDYLMNLSPYATDEMYGGTGSDALSGGMDHDRLFGELGDDALGGGAGKDLLYGGDGRDLLIGDWVSGTLSTPDEDYLDGGSGDDVLQGQEAGDTLLGGAGNDQLYGDDSVNSLVGQVFSNPTPRRIGKDYLDGGDGDDWMAAGLGDDTVYGRAGNDFLYGDNSPAGDTLVWQGGADPGTFNGFTVSTAVGGRQAFFARQGGADYLNGGEGDDYLQGDGGDDILLGGDGADQLWGDDAQVDTVEEGQDWLEGGAGNDQLVGGGGEDALFGGDGNDLLVGDYANNAVLGFDDTLAGGVGDDELQGGGGDDVLDGGDGVDRLFGENGNDTLYGGSGNDIELGGVGDDVLSGNTGDDQLDGEDGDDLVFGDEGNDMLFGGAGLDLLDGGDGDDILVAGEGDDKLFGGAGIDELQGGNGIDLLVGESGNDRLFGGAGEDRLFGDEGDDLLRGEADADVLFGGSGSDQLLGDNGDDRLYGEEGEDVLNGGLGDDFLEGGIGNDELRGEGGADTYVFNIGDGVDTITDLAGEGNRLLFGSGITSTSLTLDRGADDALLVRLGNSDDMVRITSFGVNTPSGAHPIDQFEFADGSVLSYSQLAARGFTLRAPATGVSFAGTELNDRIQGSAVNDVIDGRAGDDTIDGGDGADTIDGGAGNDSVDGGAGNDRLSGGLGANILRGGSGDDLLVSINREDRLYGGTGNDVYQLFGIPATVQEDANAGIDTVQLAPSASLSYVAPDNIENVEILGDWGLGESVQVDLFGNALDNQLMGSHRLDGAAGNDILIGQGDNTYVFGRGYGEDRIRTGEQWYARTGLDQVSFLEGIAPGDLALRLEAGHLVLSITGTEDRLIVESFTAGPHNGVDRFVFADGTVWTYDEAMSRVHEFIGTAQNDLLYGSEQDDVLRGLDGNDQLQGSAGNDILDGGAGQDLLLGSLGSDTYLFGRGSGYEMIAEEGGFSDLDTVLLGEGITQSDVALHALADNGSVQLTIQGTNDKLELGGFFMGDANRVDRIQFADGTTWDYAAMAARVQGVMLNGTDEADYLSGNVTDDSLVGNGGDDVLYGWAGNDLLDGGIGADTMQGGAGNDIYVVDQVGDVVTELSGQGTDTVQASLTYTLGANVENLTLIGTAAINGTGNALNNVLAGNSAANVLTGGAGNDTYVVGIGDTVVEAAGAGTDTVQTEASWTLESNVEKLILVGSAAVNGTGNSLANTLTGNAAANTLNGGTGADTMIGGGGDDTYIVDNVSDKVTELAGEGRDVVQSSVTYTLSANVEDLTLTGTSAINGTGNSLDNLLVGNSAANTLTGGSGNDTYVIGAGDTVVEVANAGIDTVQSSITYTLGSNVENLVLLGTAAINGTGNSLNNRLVGNNAANVLTGGAGNDTYVVGLGDSVVEAANAGVDTVESTVTWSLGANIENLSLFGSNAINGTGNTLANILIGNAGANILAGGDGNDTLSGLQGNDTLNGGNGNDLYRFGRGDGQDALVDASGTSDRLEFGTPINPLDLMLSRSANDLRIALYGTTEQVTISNWYGGIGNQIETVQAGNGQLLLNTQVDQLIQAMASFSQQSGLTWDQAIAQRPQDVQAVLAANWH